MGFFRKQTIYARTCDICGLRFPSMEAVLEHAAEEHPEELAYREQESEGEYDPVAEDLGEE